MNSMKGKIGLVFLSVFLIATFFNGLSGQVQRELIQFSGLVLDGADDQLYPIPYVNVLVKDKNRGTYSDLRGFFSIVVEKGDVIIFSAVGYRTIEYQIPDNLEDDRYSLVQLMTQDSINLPETVVFPWPSKEHFRLEFLAMDVTPDLQDRATQNVTEEGMRQLRNTLPSDGIENSSFYLRQQASEYYYYGQQPPMNIFNPFAWGKFFKSWKEGDFKKKE